MSNIVPIPEDALSGEAASMLATHLHNDAQRTMEKRRQEEHENE